MTPSPQKVIRVMDSTNETIILERKVAWFDLFDEWKTQLYKQLGSPGINVEEVIEQCSERFTKCLVEDFTRSDEEVLTRQVKRFLMDTLSYGVNERCDITIRERKLNERLIILQEEARKQELLREKTTDLERKLQNSEQQKKMKQKEMVALTKKNQHLENQLAEQILLNKVLKNEKSKRDAENAEFEKLKKENGNLKNEVNRLKGISETKTETLKDLVLENEKLQQQVKLKIEEISEMGKESRLMKRTFGKDDGLSAEQQLILKKLELSELKEKLTDPLAKAEKEHLVESYVSSPGVSKNAKKRAKRQLEDHFEATSEAVKVIQKNLESIKKHFKFTVDSLFPIPEISNPFSEEVSCLKLEELDSYEEKCGVCSKLLRTSAKSGVVVSALSQLQCHFECLPKDHHH